MKYKYMGDCAAGYVEFAKPTQPTVTMPQGEAVEVPDWLAAKLATNSHFEAVNDDKDSGASEDPPPADDSSDDDKAVELAPGTGECPDCGGIFKIRKDGFLYKHACADS